ncbi:MAG TPA: hypothetical protein VHE79_13050 [Spirochaetia bacterium]
MSGRSWYQLACDACRAGKTAEAVDALRAGRAAGEWWSPSLLDEDHDLDPIRGTPGYAAIRRECADLHAAATAASRPACTILSPATPTWEEQCLLLLHGRGMPAALLRERLAPLVGEGWTLISLQSSQPFGSAGFCWDDAVKGREEVLGQLEECRRVRGLSLGRLVVVGASRGARLAIEIAREIGVPWLGVIPSFPRDFDTGGIAPATVSPRGSLLLGTEDPFTPHARTVARMLESSGAQVRVVEMAGVGHELPDDLASHARVALEWITAGGAADDAYG